MSRNNDKLSLRQENFIQNYLVSGNAMKAALEASYAKNTAITKSALWLDKDKIRARIDRLKAKTAEKVILTKAIWLSKVLDTEARAKINGDLSAEQRSQDMQAKFLGTYSEDNAQKQPQTANIAIIESEAALDALELKLIQKQKALGNAICEG